MSASSPVAYDANVLLAAVTALSAAIAFVAALHLYARCLLRRRVAGAGAGAAGDLTEGKSGGSRAGVGLLGVAVGVGLAVLVAA